MSIYRLRITGDLGFEVWADIPGYEGLYQVSTYGRVRSISRTHIFGHGVPEFYSEKLLAYSYSRGYESVALCRNTIKRRFTVHKLVALLFLPNPDNLPQINHKDENKQNNRVENLEWCTAKYNTNYGTGIKRRVEKLTKTVVQYNINGQIIKIYPSIATANKETTVGKGNIWACCFGKRKTAGGYIWKFA